MRWPHRTHAHSMVYSVPIDHYGEVIIVHTCTMSHAEFLGETSNHPGDSALLQPRFGAQQVLVFPKTKITFEREEISAIEEIQENMTGPLMVTGRTV